MKKKYLLIISVVLALIALAVLLYRWPGRTATEPEPEPTSTLTLRTATNRPRTTKKPSTSSKKRGVAIPGWSSIELPAGETEADVKLYNPTDNDGKYYLVFELRLQDSGETLFTTGLVPPGTYCSHVTLTRALDDGLYMGVMHVQPVRMDDQTTTNSADISITIDVK